MVTLCKWTLLILLVGLVNINTSYAALNAKMECSLKFKLYAKNDGGTLLLPPISGSVLRDEPTFKYVRFNPSSHSLSAINASMTGFEVILEATYFRTGIIPNDPSDWWVLNSGYTIGIAHLVKKDEMGKIQSLGSAEFSSNLVSSPKELEQLKNGMASKRIPFTFKIRNGDYLSWSFNQKLVRRTKPTPEEENQLTEVNGECQYIQTN